MDRLNAKLKKLKGPGFFAKGGRGGKIMGGMGRGAAMMRGPLKVLGAAMIAGQQFAGAGKELGERRMEMAKDKG